MSDKKVRNVTVDSDVQELLVALQEELEVELGFRPTLSQTIKLVIKRASPRAGK